MRQPQLQDLLQAQKISVKLSMYEMQVARKQDAALSRHIRGLPVEEFDAIPNGRWPSHVGKVGIEGLQINLQLQQGLHRILFSICNDSRQCCLPQAMKGSGLQKKNR